MLSLSFLVNHVYGRLWKNWIGNFPNPKFLLQRVYYSLECSSVYPPFYMLLGHIKYLYNVNSIFLGKKECNRLIVVLHQKWLPLCQTDSGENPSPVLFFKFFFCFSKQRERVVFASVDPLHHPGSTNMTCLIIFFAMATTNMKPNSVRRYYPGRKTKHWRRGPGSIPTKDLRDLYYNNSADVKLFNVYHFSGHI